jgi:hypothetical protein
LKTELADDIQISVLSIVCTGLCNLSGSTYED